MLILAVLLPVGIWITRSIPADLGLSPDGIDTPSATGSGLDDPVSPSRGVAAAVRSANFWLILVGATLVIGAIGAVIQHFILFLKDQGYSATAASRFFAALLPSSLCGRVLVGYLADRFQKKNLMAFSIC